MVVDIESCAEEVVAEVKLDAWKWLVVLVSSVTEVAANGCDRVVVVVCNAHCDSYNQKHRA